MSQPFRDEMAAALDRAERLAQENDELRAQLAKIRIEVDAPAPEPAPPPRPPDSLTRNTLARLDELSEQIDAHAPVEPLAPVAIDAPRARVATNERAAAPLAPESLEARVRDLERENDALTRRVAVTGFSKREEPRPIASIVVTAFGIGAVVGFVLARLFS